LKPLQLPLTIRTARPDEIPYDEENLLRIEERETAKNYEGYMLHNNETYEDPFQFFAEMNIDNERLWS